MMLKRIERRDGSAPPDAGEFAAFLRQRGIIVGDVSAGVLREDGAVVGWWINADVDRDPTTDVAAYVPPVDQSAAAVTYLRARVADIKAKPAIARTQPERDVLAIVTILRGIDG